MDKVAGAMELWCDGVLEAGMVWQRGESRGVEVRIEVEVVQATVETRRTARGFEMVWVGAA